MPNPIDRLHIHTFTPDEVVSQSVALMAEKLHSELQDHRVLLLISGGSASSLYLPLFERLVDQGTNLSKLTVSLFDERYVGFGSADSNEQQLRELGVLDFLQKHNAHVVPYLDTSDRSGSQIALQVTSDFQQVLTPETTLIIIAGIGDDGHTAGLLPTTNEQIIKNVYESTQSVVYYDLSEDIINPFRHRITVTPALIKQADHIFVYAITSKKKTALERFVRDSETISHCPSLVLLRARGPVEICTDQVLWAVKKPDYILAQISTFETMEILLLWR